MFRGRTSVKGSNTTPVFSLELAQTILLPFVLLAPFVLHLGTKGSLFGPARSHPRRQPLPSFLLLLGGSIDPLGPPRATTCLSNAHLLARRQLEGALARAMALCGRTTEHERPKFDRRRGRCERLEHRPRRKLEVNSMAVGSSRGETKG